MMIQYRDRKPLFGVSSPASQASAALKCIVESPSLLRDLKQIALAVQTFSLESFQCAHTLRPKIQCLHSRCGESHESDLINKLHGMINLTELD